MFSPVTTTITITTQIMQLHTVKSPSCSYNSNGIGMTILVKLYAGKDAKFTSELANLGNCMEQQYLFTKIRFCSSMEMETQIQRKSIDTNCQTTSRTISLLNKFQLITKPTPIFFFKLNVSRLHSLGSQCHLGLVHI